MFKAFKCLVFTAAVSILTACGGGSGGSDTGGGGQQVVGSSTSTSGVSVKGSLGQIRNADVRVLDKDLVQVGSIVEIGPDGAVDFEIADDRYPIVVEILGDNDAEYFDEAQGVYLPLPPSFVLRAVVPAPQDTIAVTPLTNVAAARLAMLPGGLASVDSATIREQNNAVRDLLAPAIDITRDVTIVGDTSAQLGNSASDLYALLIAICTQIADNASVSSLEFFQQLADDWSDGEFDGKVFGVDIVNALVADADDLNTSIDNNANTVVNVYGNGVVDFQDFLAFRTFNTGTWNWYYSAKISFAGEVDEVPEVLIATNIPSEFIPTEDQFETLEQNFQQSIALSGIIGEANVELTNDTNSEVNYLFRFSGVIEGFPIVYEINYRYVRQ